MPAAQFMKRFLRTILPTAVAIFIALSVYAFPPAGEEIVPAELRIRLYDKNAPATLVEEMSLFGLVRHLHGSPYNPGDGRIEKLARLDTANLAGVSVYFDTEASLYIAHASGSNGGRYKQLSAGIDWPAESFFDITYQIDLSTLPPKTIGPKLPVRLSDSVWRIPPEGRRYTQLGTTLIYDIAADTAMFLAGHVLIFDNPAGDSLAFASCAELRFTPGSVQPAPNDPPQEIIQLLGPTIVRWSDPFDPGDGRPEIETEIIAMSLTGVSSALGAVQFIVPTPLVPNPSIGQAKSDGTTQLFPMESFFDVFYQLNATGPGMQLIPKASTRPQWSALIESIPPDYGTPPHYEDPNYTPIYNGANPVAPVGWISPKHWLKPDTLPDPLTGACCDAQGNCTEISEFDCRLANQSYQGDGVSCAPNPCPQPPTGACCDDQGNCTKTTLALCQQQNGSYQGDNTTCSPNPCPQPPTGACCHPQSDTCMGEFTAALCQSSGGVYQGDGVECVIGASCGCCNTPGDADNGGDVNIGDVTWLIAYIFQGGFAPPCMKEGDADSGGDVNIGDVTFVIGYIFQGGSAPACL